MNWTWDIPTPTGFRAMLTLIFCTTKYEFYKIFSLTLNLLGKHSFFVRIKIWESSRVTSSISNLRSEKKDEKKRICLLDFVSQEWSVHWTYNTDRKKENNMSEMWRGKKREQVQRSFNIMSSISKFKIRKSHKSPIHRTDQTKSTNTMFETEQITVV